MFLELDDNIKNNKVFSDAKAAVDSVLNKALEVNIIIN